MFEKYNNLFDSYLRICKDRYDENNPYNNLEECCKNCEQLKWALFGMLDLMCEIGEITRKVRDKELMRVSDSLSTVTLFNAYMSNSEVMVFSK